MTTLAPQPVTGLVLAGGKGTRMGGTDKGLAMLAGRPLVAHVLERLLPQVGKLIINVNRNLDIYRGFGHPVVSDCIEGFAGPLAGMHAGLAACTTPLMVAAACDSPFLPADLVARLTAGLGDALVAVPRTSDGLQPTFALMRREALEAIETFLVNGGRGIQAWCREVPLAVVDFPDADAFVNINTPEELLASAASRHG